MELELMDNKPMATFYLWAKIPAKYGNDDIKFCLDLATKGVITSPSTWVSESIKGRFRIALVPGEEEILDGMDLIKSLC